MSDGVARLKDLLFDDERRQQQEFARRLDAVFERAGTDDRFRASVAGVLDGALRTAEVERHAELSQAMAPLVVRTIKTEIRNSQDELVEALYPMTGRMVKAYVASAMKDMIEQINRRLETNPAMLRLKSLMTGRSVAELAIAETQRLEVEELYLIRRGSGSLIGHWPSAAASKERDQMVGGVLAAINEFTSEVLKDEGSAMRQIDLGDRRLYLRASPSYLLAAKCSGSAPDAVEQVIDDAFLSSIERYQSEIGDAPAGADTPTPDRILTDLSQALESAIADKQAALRGSGVGASPVKVLAWMVGVPLAAWIAWGIYADWRTERTRSAAASVIAGTSELQGYPTQLAVEKGGGRLAVSGLAPSAEVRDTVLQNLGEALPGVTVETQIAIVPSGMLDVAPEIAKVRSELEAMEPVIGGVRRDLAGLEPEVDEVRRNVAGFETTLTRSSVERAFDRASRRLGQVLAELPRLEAYVQGDAMRELVAHVRSTTESAISEIETYAAALAAPGTDRAGLDGLRGPVGALSTRLAGASMRLAGSIADGGGSSVGESAGAAQSIAEAAEDLAAHAERLATMVVAVTQVHALKHSLPAPGPTPRQKLEAFAKANAVFFANGVEYRDPQSAGRTLDQLAELMRGGEALVRVVGYTDEKGNTTQNSPLSQDRADKVLKALTERGVSPNRLVAVGRTSLVNLSPLIGEQSPNRRVEFEIGFEGEALE